MKKLILTLLLGAAISHAQIPNPQIPVTGMLGPGGSAFPLCNAGTLIFSSDANHTMVFPEMTACVLKVTSSVPLTATRNLIAPLALGFDYVIENATTGGQSIQIIGSTGAGVMIPNGTAVHVISDGTNYISAGSSGGGSMTWPASAGIANYSGSSSWGTSYSASNQIPGNFLTVFGPSGGSHAPGAVPDPGSSAGTTHFLREDGTWSVPAGGGTGCTPGGVTNSVQVNNGSGGCTGDANLTFNPSTDAITASQGAQFVFNQTLSLPGYNFGSPGTGTSAGALASSVYWMNTTAFGQGNHNGVNGDMIENGNGDVNSFVINGTVHGANIAGSDQGYTGFADQMYLAKGDIYTANVSSTGVPSGFPGVTLFATGFSGSYGVGRWLIDKTTALTFTATSATKQGSGLNIYSAVTETGQTFTPSIQGSLSAGVNGPSVPNNNNTPILATFTVTIASSCSVGDQFTIGGINTESAKIVSITSFTGGVMTATAWLRSSHESSALFMCEGPTGRLLEQNADDNLGTRYLFVVLGAINSTTLAVAREIPNGMDNAFINGSGTDTIYPGARIVDARDPSSGLSNTGNMTLAETSATFTAGDALEVPNGLTQLSTRILVNANDNNPYNQGNIFSVGCPIHSTDCGDLLANQGVFSYQNGNPNSAYTVGGGRWFLKPYNRINGPVGAFGYYFSIPVAPMFEFQELAGGQANIWQVDDTDFFEQLQETSGFASTFLSHANNFNYAGPTSTATNFSIKGYFLLPELATPPSPITGTDILYADQTTHSIRYSANGGAFSSLGSGGGTPGGSSGNLQYNNGGTSFGGDANTNDDGAGNLTAVSFHSTGAGAGAYFMVAGAPPSPTTSTVVITAPASVPTGYNFIMPAGPPGVATNQLFQCSGTTSAACSFITGSMQTAASASNASYSDVSFNGNHADGTRLGLLGGNSGSADPSLYLDLPTGGHFAFRINSVNASQIGQIASSGYYGLSLNGGNFTSTGFVGVQGDPTGTDASLYLNAKTGGQINGKIANVTAVTFSAGTAPTGVCAGNFLILTASDGKVSRCNGSTYSSTQIGSFQAQTIYSAAGTPVPTCNSGAHGTIAVVSDATTPTYLGTYTSGGAVETIVECNGTNWITH